jgi:hypothetical protein
MAKKHWIYIKRGLSEDPKHRAAMGECIWLFMHIIDRADWETGIAIDWKDEIEAADMSMPVTTLRHQRRKLEELDYIRSKQRQRSQDIYILEWINPRNYSSEVKNPRNQGDNGLTPSEIQGDNHGDNAGDNHVSSGVNTPSSTSESTPSPKGAELTEKEKAQANAKVDAMIANAKKVTYRNREKLPEPYLMFGDLYFELTKQEPTKSDLMDWMGTFEEWKQKGLRPEHIRAAFAHAARDGGFPVGRPGSLTNTAVGMKTKMLTNAAPAINDSAVETTKQTVEEKFSGEFTPRPDHVPAPVLIKQKLQEAAQQRRIRK